MDGYRVIRMRLMIASCVLLILIGGLALGGWRPSGFFASKPSEIYFPAADGKATIAPELSAGTWINSEPLTLKSLRGRVVLVEFWTFGCYNCRNTLPFVKSWYKRYADHGLTVIGVHSPELELERNIENVRREVASLEIRYPVVTDNDYSTWRAYSVDAWPTIFLIDKEGHIRWSHVGEGAYDQAEQLIQKLLAEGSSKLSSQEKSRMSEKIMKTEEEWRRELTPEQYRVLRQSGTERAFTGALWDNHEHGTYYCAACGAKLFTSDAKFESGSGWPSFYAAASESSVDLRQEDSLGMSRTEVRCHRCGSHLGHVFDDGPLPTGLRYCMNSIALRFETE